MVLFEAATDTVFEVDNDVNLWLGLVMVAFNDKYDLSIPSCCYLLWFIIAIIYLFISSITTAYNFDGFCES